MGRGMRVRLDVNSQPAIRTMHHLRATLSDLPATHPNSFTASALASTTSPTRPGSPDTLSSAMFSLLMSKSGARPCGRRGEGGESDG